MSLDTMPTKRECTEDRRAAISKAAGDIIIEKGLAGLRTRDIAARVGINIATLHYHVPSKEALVALVADSLRNYFIEQSQRHPLGDKTGLQQLRLEFSDFRETVVEKPGLIIILTELVERARRDAAVAAIMLPMLNYWRNQYVELFRIGIADGSFRPDLDAEAAALICTGALSDCWRQSTIPLSMLDQVLAELERGFVRKC